MISYKQNRLALISLFYAALVLLFIFVLSFVSLKFIGLSDEISGKLIPMLDSYTTVEKIQIPLERVSAAVAQYPGTEKQNTALLLDFDVLYAKFQLLVTDSPLRRDAGKNAEFLKRVEEARVLLESVDKNIAKLKSNIGVKSETLNELDLVRKKLNDINNIGYEIQINQYRDLINAIKTKAWLFIIAFTIWFFTSAVCGLLFFLFGLRFRIASEQKEKAVERKNAFIAAASHELRTPLQAVIGALETLTITLDSKFGNTESDDIAILKTRIERHVSNIEERMRIFGSYARLEAGKIEKKITTVDVHSLIDDTVEAFRDKAEANNLMLISDVNLDSHLYLIDDNLISEVLENLVANALKFTEHGYVKIIVSMQLETLLFQVEDSGIGIPSDAIPEIFNPFFKIDHAFKIDSASDRGIGLGLAIVADLVKLMDGKIDVRSRQGHGTTVSVYVPAWKAA